MAVIRGFRDLIAYQKARAAAKSIFELSGHFPREERFSLTDQMRRASRAVGGMIAEAWGRRRYRAVWINKLDEALGESAETQAWLDAAMDSGYINQEKHRENDALYQELRAVITGLIEQADSFCHPPKP